VRRRRFRTHRSRPGATAVTLTGAGQQDQQREPGRARSHGRELPPRRPRHVATRRHPPQRPDDEGLRHRSRDQVPLTATSWRSSARPAPQEAPSRVRPPVVRTRQRCRARYPRMRTRCRCWSQCSRRTSPWRVDQLPAVRQLQPPRNRLHQQTNTGLCLGIVHHRNGHIGIEGEPGIAPNRDREPADQTAMGAVLLQQPEEALNRGEQTHDDSFGAATSRGRPSIQARVMASSAASSASGWARANC